MHVCYPSRWRGGTTLKSAAFREIHSGNSSNVFICLTTSYVADGSQRHTEVLYSLKLFNSNILILTTAMRFTWHLLGPQCPPGQNMLFLYRISYHENTGNSHLSKIDSECYINVWNVNIAQFSVCRKFLFEELHEFTWQHYSVCNVLHIFLHDTLMSLLLTKKHSFQIF